ncbi:MAG: hypothetical protein OXI23_09730 [Gemmatimonadota bacterium]|nr:hypothetical protein [Gemmatimonadota bacterium]
MQVTTEFKGFRFAGCLFGGVNAMPVVQYYKAKSAISLVAGDTVAFQSATDNDVVLGTSAKSHAGLMVGVCNQTKSFAAGDLVPVIVNADAVFEVYDTTERTIGLAMEVQGASGAQTAGVSNTAADNDTWRVAWTSDGKLTYVTWADEALRILDAKSTAAA